MRSRVFGKWLFFALLFFVVFSRAASATIDVYQIRGSADFGIYVLNTTAGTDQRIFAGSYPGGSSATLAQRPSDGMLFYVINAANAQIYQYNPATPAVAPVALPNTLGAGVPASFRMAFSPNGTLYYMPDTGILYTIATTGAGAGIATPGPTVTGLGSGGDMAFINNTSFYVINSSRQLYTCATAGGAAAPVGGGTGTITFPGGITPATLGLAFDSAGRLLTQTQNPSNFYSINTGALTATLVGSLGGGITPTGDLASANVPDPNLSITKTNGVTSLYTGAPVTYTVVVTNNGTYSVTGTVTDTVPATLTGVNWACAASAGSFCAAASGAGNAISTSATLAPAGTATYTITATVSGTASGAIANTATVAVPAWLTDSNTANNTATDSDPVVAAANISIAKTAAAATFAVGANAVYTLAVANAGPQSAAGTITVTDTLPAGLTYVPGTSPGWTCGAAGAVVTCTHPGPLASAASLPNITLTVSVAAAAAPNVTNTATVSSPTFDPTPANNSSSVTRPVIYIQLVKSVVVNGPQAVPGTTLTYTINFNNLGGVAVSNLIVSDKIPVETEFSIGSAAYSPGSSGLPAPIVEYTQQPRNPANEDPPSPWVNYTPPGAPGTYDSTITYVRYRFATGNLNAGTSGSVSFIARIR